MLNIIADALFIATRFGPLPGDDKRRARQREVDYAAATDSDLRNWEAQRTAARGR